MKTNVTHVIKFEIVRNLKKPFFWIAALILPILLIGYVAFAGMVGYNTNQVAEGGTDTTDLRLGLFDAPGFLDLPADASDFGFPNQNGDEQLIAIIHTKEQGIAAIKNDTLDVFYYLPADFDQTFSAQVYAKSTSLNIFSNYEAPLRTVLMLSAASRIDPLDLAIVTGTIEISTTNFTADNETIDLTTELSRMIIPGLGLVLFYILIVTFGNRLTTAMVEEKENRISEMILTSLRPSDLITGKIISLIALGFIQLAVLLIPIIILTIFGFAHNFIPAGITIDFNPWTILSTLILLLSSFFLFTALCITIGTLVPTAKDAGQFAGVIMILVILPIFFISSFMSSTSTDTMTYVLSYFPPSAPIALMFRNLFGTLPLHEYFIGLAVIAASSYLIIKFSVWVYTRTALDFTSRINLRKLLATPRKTWK